MSQPTPGMAGASADTGLSAIPQADVGSYGGVANVTAGQAGAQAATATANSGSVMDALKNFGTTMKENKEITAMGLYFLGGAFDDKKKAETNLLNAQTDNARLTGQLATQRAANANAIPDISGLKVNPRTVTPPNYMAPRPGLMNS